MSVSESASVTERASQQSDLCYLTASEAIALFQARKLSPRELMAATIARIEAVNPRINAISDRYFEEALEHEPAHGLALAFGHRAVDLGDRGEQVIDAPRQ